MLGHLGINVPDLPGARRYYETIMPLLGFERYLDADDQRDTLPAVRTSPVGYR
jgi:catechol 2,3-dioxygenase-like lactoylglutathione lyase family enzyme